jgi:hypothetical protein
VEEIAAVKKYWFGENRIQRQGAAKTEELFASRRCDSFGGWHGADALKILTRIGFHFALIREIRLKAFSDGS